MVITQLSDRSETPTLHATDKLRVLDFFPFIAGTTSDLKRYCVVYVQQFTWARP